MQGDKRDRHPDKTTEEVLGILDDARAWADEVVFTGGEITVRRDLPELIEYARSIGFRIIQLQTNGRMLSVPRVVERLAAAGVTEFSPALHGPNAAIHDGSTSVKGSFRQTLTGIRNVRRIGLPVVLNSVITRANHRHLRAMARLFVALEVDQFQFAFVHALGSAAAHFDEVVPRLSAVGPYAREALEVGEAAGVSCMTEAIPLCFLGRFAHLAAEWRIPRTRIYDADQIVEDYTETRLREGKAKGPPCEGCAARDRCEGPWREYPARFGWGEFVPLR